MCLSAHLHRLFSTKRPVTLTTGQFADLKLADLARKCHRKHFRDSDSASGGIVRAYFVHMNDYFLLNFGMVTENTRYNAL
jgi:hypothetical protein